MKRLTKDEARRIAAKHREAARAADARETETAGMKADQTAAPFEIAFLLTPSGASTTREGRAEIAVRPLRWLPATPPGIHHRASTSSE
jgi:hypothetical protein